MKRMNGLLKNVFNRLPVWLQNFIKYNYNKITRDKIASEWRKAGSVLPPPHSVKQLTVESYRRNYGCELFVETGTYLGEMVLAQKKNFKKIYSIEIAPKLFDEAKKRFAGYSHVKILFGDSGKVLNQVIPELDSKSLFWLDGHYSAGETGRGAKVSPVFEELNAILKMNKFRHIILIDDARLFIGEHDYPTISDLKVFVGKLDPGYKLEAKDDIIRLVPEN
jgi:hypothetical protein